MSDAELYAYFKWHQGDACGRFQSSQLGVVAPPAVMRRGWLRPAALLGLLPMVVSMTSSGQSPVPVTQSYEPSAYDADHGADACDGGGTVSRRVVDEQDNSPLPGVSVSLKNSNTGTTTDSGGSFALSLLPQDQPTMTLVFASVGYEVAEKEVSADSTGDMGQIALPLAVMVLREFEAISSHTVGGFSVVERAP